VFVWTYSSLGTSYQLVSGSSLVGHIFKWKKVMMALTGFLGVIMAALTAAAPTMILVGLLLVALGITIRFIKAVWNMDSAQKRFLDLATNHPEVIRAAR